MQAECTTYALTRARNRYCLRRQRGLGEAWARDDRWAQPSRSDSGRERRHYAPLLLLITDESEPWLPAHYNDAGRDVSQCVRLGPGIMWNSI
jgi:hypothetical protein